MLFYTIVSISIRLLYFRIYTLSILKYSLCLSENTSESINCDSSFHNSYGFIIRFITLNVKYVTLRERINTLILLSFYPFLKIISTLNWNNINAKNKVFFGALSSMEFYCGLSTNLFEKVKRMFIWLPSLNLNEIWWA